MRSLSLNCRSVETVCSCYNLSTKNNCNKLLSAVPLKLDNFNWDSRQDFFNSLWYLLSAVPGFNCDSRQFFHSPRLTAIWLTLHHLSLSCLLYVIVIAPHWVLWLVYVLDARGRSACIPPVHDECYDWFIALGAGVQFKLCKQCNVSLHVWDTCTHSGLGCILLVYTVTKFNTYGNTCHQAINTCIYFYTNSG